MPQSISKAQAELLSSGFLDTLGSKPEFNDLDITESLAALILLAGELIEEANSNLQQGGHIGQGKLSDSLKVLNPEYVGKQIQLDIEALFYYQFINKGVRGTQSGGGLYSFKSSFPSRKMVSEIAKWLKTAKKATSNVSRPVGNLETKRKSISQLNKAYAVARSIKMHGIKATNFFDKAVKVAQSHAKEELGKALKIDIINSLPTNLNDYK